MTRNSPECATFPPEPDENLSACAQRGGGTGLAGPLVQTHSTTAEFLDESIGRRVGHGGECVCSLGNFA
jgi:hypothetical protein